MNSVKNLLLSIGALLSFVVFILLFGLIFYQLFGSGNDEQDQGKKLTTLKSSTPSTKESLTVTSSTPTNKPNVLSNWKGFKRLWKAKSELERAQLLVNNVNSNPNSTWNAKLNKYTIGIKSLNEMVNFTDSFDPLNSTYMMDPARLRSIKEYIEKVFKQHYNTHLINLEQQLRPIPERFNAAQRWGDCAHSILRVRDQGGCGSCWAVAAISVISDRICIASEGKELNGISAQQLVECCDYCGGCTGAPNSFFPFFYWHKEGLVTDRCFPYTIARDCGSPCPPTEFQNPRGLGKCSFGELKCADEYLQPLNYKAKYVYKLGSLEGDDAVNPFPKPLTSRLKANESGQFKGRIGGIVELLKRELMEHGPVMLCFSVFESFMHYHDGVYNFDLQPNEQHVYDHCAKIIGWGRQRRPNAVGVQNYLIAVNSWGSLWAKDGTFKIDIDRLAYFHSDLFGGVPDI
ncbi:Pept_C1 domain-containing protein [Meloidogyne graminicola]|uniref:Pept_C1 domain-containing protein n=1 Tax=Meloidogyne graminicola TaxID=189291 RepID=A0A8S9ZJP5_9BILA|nr:Pept_C1 domain-containing protein [Meloidogyne graminicola]